jgi:opacity protein-like surface antigen
MTTPTQPVYSNVSRAVTLALLAVAWLGMPEAHAQDPWTGRYLGLTTGTSKSLIDGTTLKADGTVGGNATDEAANSLRDDAQAVAVNLGFRKRLDSGLIFGLETQVARLDHQARTQDLIEAGVFAGQPSATLRYETPWLATARAVAGWSWGDLLVFGSGGAAFAQEKVTRTQYRTVAGTNTTAAQFSEIDREVRLGYALGMGMEWRWSKRWAVRAEYLQVRFPGKEFRFPDARGGAQGSFNDVQGRVATNRANLDTLQIGLTYSFGLGN